MAQDLSWHQTKKQAAEKALAGSVMKRAESAPLLRSATLPHRAARQSWGTIGLVGAGSMLESYEFQTFAMFTPVISNVFFSHDQPAWVRELQTLALLSIGFFFRPIAGAVVGQIGDRLGRKASFLVTILLMALPTLGIGLLPGYAQIGIFAPIILLLLRVMQGMASAGEMSGAAVFVTESAPQDRVGLASGSLYGAIHFGYFMAAAVTWTITASLPPSSVQSFGWRLAFILGGLLGLVALWARRRLHESPAFEAAKTRRASLPKSPIGSVLGGQPGRIVTVMLLAGYVGLSIAMPFTFGPLLLRETYKISASDMSGITSASFVVLSLAAFGWGALGDRIGIRKAFSLGCLLIIGVTLAFSIFHGPAIANPVILLGWYLVFAVALGSVGCAFAIAASQFPTEIRLTGLGFSYNLGLAIFSGSAPFLVSYFSHEYGGVAIIGYLWAAAAIGLVAVRLAAPLGQPRMSA